MWVFLVCSLFGGVLGVCVFLAVIGFLGVKNHTNSVLLVNCWILDSVWHDGLVKISSVATGWVLGDGSDIVEGMRCGNSTFCGSLRTPSNLATLFSHF